VCAEGVEHKAGSITEFMVNHDNGRRMNEALKNNLEAFARNNAARIREIQRIGSKGTKSAFLQVPFLLQANHPSVPGFVDAPQVPRGIAGFHRSNFHLIGRKAYTGKESDYNRLVYVSEPVIQSLLLMGSSGSVGHTAASDLDYWVCFDRALLGEEGGALLRRKMDAITEWADKNLRAEVNFYAHDVTDLVNNRIKPQGEKTEGEVAPGLLKEELYRTVVHVLGRVPVWWSTPAETGPSAYRRIRDILLGATGTNLVQAGFIDLGFPALPGPQEYMSAAMWLSRKSEADLFKAALKMVIILEQVESGLNAPLVCDDVKASVLSASTEELPVDPYVLMIRRVLDYATQHLDDNHLDLIRTSAYYKIRGALDPAKTSPDDPKAQLLTNLVVEWGWPQERVDRLNRYSQWSDRERLELGRDMKKLLFDLYLQTAKRLMNDFPEEVRSEDRSLDQFKARMLSRYSDHEYAVEALPSSLDRRTLPRTMTLYYNGERWELYGSVVGGRTSEDEEENKNYIRQFPSVASAAAWLVHNDLYDETLKLRLMPRPGPVSLDTMNELLKTIKRLFPPLTVSEVGEHGGFRHGGVGSRLVIINLEASWLENKILSTDLIYRTAWGEMRSVPSDLSRQTNEADKFLQIADKILATGKLSLDTVHFFVPPGTIGRKMKNNLLAALSQAFNGTRRRSGGFRGPTTKMQLDTD
jgi:adenylate cyclase class 1